MLVNREELLQKLEAVSPGLAKKDSLEQSSCFVIYNDGRVATFNEELACFNQTALRGIEGAVAADPLRALLQKLDEESIDISIDHNELRVQGNRRKSGLAFQETIALALDRVEAATDWKTVDPILNDAMAITCKCAATDGSGSFYLTCVHFHPDYVEACDNLQILRYTVQTGITSTLLLKAASVQHIAGLGMTEVAETENWLHFRNPTGLTLACRKYVDDFPDITNFLSVTDSTTVSLPTSLVEAAEKADIFSSQNADNNRVTIALKDNKVMLTGRGGNGWYTEVKEAKYSGPEIKFMISAKILAELISKSPDALICPGRIVVDAGTYKYSSSLGAV